LPLAREDIFVTTKLWNSDHRPERVEPAFEASLERLGLMYLDLYLSITEYAITYQGRLAYTVSIVDTATGG
jgi:diketogulonate reductase-like aldo/keto reductase